MATIVKAKCPQCATVVSVEEEVSPVPVTCASCEHGFVPAMVIAESNRKFEIGMYAVMLLVGVGLIGYMAMTGQLKPKPDEAAVPQAVVQNAAATDAGGTETPATSAP